MKIATISDLHDNLENLTKCLNWCKQNKINQLICLGDVTNSQTLNYLAKNFKNNIYLVTGNAEIYNENELKKFKNIKFYGEYGSFNIDNKKVGICHEKYLVNKIIKENKVDIIFYGHSHKPWQEKVRQTRLINPGTLAGLFYKASFAVWSTESGKIELKILEQIK
ncbi:MAG: YfcE family phosphodiesterase [Patescibacteria group bacterium]